MSYALIKKMCAFALPVALLAAAFVALHKVRLLPQAQQELTCYAPYLTLSGGIALSLAFNRGRALFALLILGLFYLVDRNYLLQGMDDFAPRTLYLCSSLLIPLNLGLFCFIRERGIFCHAGRLRLGFLALQAGAVFWIVRFRQDYHAIPDLIGRPLVGSTLLDGLLLPQSGLLLFLVAGLCIAIRALKKGYPIDLALLGTLVALGITLNRIGTDFVPALFVTAAALLLTIGVLQDSHNMAFFDDLTGLPSRRALNEQVLGLGRNFVVAMLDVDHFKKFNDSYGHDVGDQVLKMVGAKIAAVKGGGRPFRYGGEEFAILFPRKGLKEVVPHLEQLRQSIADYQLLIRGADRPKEAAAGKSKRSAGVDGRTAVSVTVSIGVAVSGEELRKPAEVIKVADTALYQAKQRGRNRTVSA